MSNKLPVTFELNGDPVTVQVSPDELLIDVLRERLYMTGVKRGCFSGSCGACTVLLNNRAQKSCKIRALQIAGAAITTIEGLATGQKLHPLQAAFLTTGAVQCGFCTPGMILRSLDYISNQSVPDRNLIQQALSPNLCRCTGYLPIIDAVLAVINGVPLSLNPQDYRPEMVARVTGQALFAADYQVPDVLHAAIVWSQYPHARILAINCSRAKSSQGVVAVLTHESVPGFNHYGKVRQDQPLLAEGEVAMVGDAIAVVVADTIEHAHSAAHLVSVDYEPLPVKTLEPEASAPVVGQSAEDRIVADFTLKKGDVAHALAKAALVVREVYSTQRVEHAVLELDSAIAAPHGRDSLIVIGPTQNVFFDRVLIARLLGLDKTQVRVIQPYVGGAFGKREDIFVQLIAALCAYMVKRPVKVQLDRRESFIATTKRHPMVLEHVAALDEHHTIIGWQVTITADAGPYTSWAPNILRKAAVHAIGPYRVPNVEIRAQAVATNNLNSGAMRGFGAPQALFAAESHIELIARTVGIDSLTLRERHVLHQGDETVTGQLLTFPVPLTTIIAQLRATRSRLIEQGIGSDGSALGWALSFYGVGYGNGIPDLASAIVELTPAGSITVKVGAVDYGQGLKTTLALIAADELAVDHTTVTVCLVDSARTPDCGSTVASRQTTVTGNAVRAASKMLAEKILALAAKLKGHDREDVILNASWVLSRTSGALISFAELAASSKGASLNAQARFSLKSERLDAATGQGAAYQDYTFGGNLAVVTRDSKGQLIVKLVTAVHQTGAIINKTGLAGQVTGAILMGAGMALMENFACCEGYPTCSDYHQYRIPRSTDLPAIELSFLEVRNPLNPLGVKAIGEPAMLAVVPAIINAARALTGEAITTLPYRAGRDHQVDPT